MISFLSIINIFKQLAFCNILKLLSGKSYVTEINNLMEKITKIEFKMPIPTHLELNFTQEIVFLR